MAPGDPGSRATWRRGIQRQSRDIGLNMGVLFLVWLLFLATLALRIGG